MVNLFQRKDNRKQLWSRDFIDGSFRVDKPPVLLGYTYDKSGRVGTDAEDSDPEATYITLFVTIEPPLTPADPVRERFDSNEEETLLQTAEVWQMELEKKFEKREYKTLVVDINGKSVFITRYLRSLKPPEELLADAEGKRREENVARFVSMIPFVSDSVTFPGLCDIWSTCDQFLQMLQGDEEEHAVLLACYFLHMGKKAWLVIGTAIPEGPTAYVLTKEDKGYRLWNASTGEHFSHRDNYCPVQSVGCLVDVDNIYANIQQNDLPARMSFDVTNTSCWKPFFHKGFSNPGISSIQPEALLYTITDRGYVLDLQEKIERKVREKLMEWRSKQPTRWNRHCVTTFRELLPDLEMKRGASAQREHKEKLASILGSYKMCGFPINSPYTTMEPVFEAVYSTGVHRNDSQHVEFAVAVHLHAYPNTVLSLWVYVASLEKIR